MSVFNLKRSVFYMDKKILKSFLNGYDKYKIISFSIANDNANKNTICLGCPFENKNNEIISSYCTEYCDKLHEYNKVNIGVIATFNKVKYRNKKIVKKYSGKMFKNKDVGQYFKRIHLIPKINRFSASQIKQFILFNYLCDSNGFIKKIRKSVLCDLLECTSATLKRNNIIFRELGLIDFTDTLDNNRGISIFIRNFKSMLGDYIDVKDQVNKGTGNYISVTLNFLKDILKMKRVSLIKTFIFSLLKEDANKVYNHPTKIFKERLEGILSINNLSKPGILKVLESIKDVTEGAFGFSSTDQFMVVDMNEEHYFAEHFKKNRRKNYYTKFNDFINTNNIALPLDRDKIVKDLVSLCDNYNYADVEGVFALDDDYSSVSSDKIGAIVRTRLLELYGPSKLMINKIYHKNFIRLKGVVRQLRVSNKNKSKILKLVAKYSLNTSVDEIVEFINNLSVKSGLASYVEFKKAFLAGI